MGKTKGVAPQTFEQLYENRRNACLTIMKVHRDAGVPMIPEHASWDSGITAGELTTEARLQHWMRVPVDIGGTIYAGWEPKGE